MDMKKEKDILENGKLKEAPFKVPEGYFENLAVHVEARRKAEERGLMHRLTPYLAIAASFAAITLAGTAVIRLTAPKEVVEATTASTYYSQNTAGQGMTEDDIINYLIYAGISADELNEITAE